MLAPSNRPWSPDSWKERPAGQQPHWPDPAHLDRCLTTLRSYPALVFAGEVRALEDSLRRAASGQAFLLQGGDCAESFSQFTADAIRDKLRVILQMALVLTYGLNLPVVKVGRIAGQFAKPRSSDHETRGEMKLPSYRGDCVNDAEFTAQARIADPERLLRAYFHAASTLNLLRAYASGGFADLHRVHLWNQDFVARSPQGKRYAELAEKISGALRFMEACGVNSENTPSLQEIHFYTSHEALILGYEQALTRRDPVTGDFYGCSAHMLWIGDRTRQVDGAHVEFLRGIKNPLGLKVGPSLWKDDLLKLCEILNPENRPGRLTLITRFGHQKIEELLPPLIEVVKREGMNVVWSSDPMHGNTFTTSEGYKTRSFEHILSELRSFCRIHQSLGTHPGGVHFELTGEDVTECTGGAQAITTSDLGLRYESACDPRLNNEQSLEMAFLITEILRDFPRNLQPKT